jgi:hypothetical protein
VDRRDFLARAELLAACGMTTLQSASGDSLCTVNDISVGPELQPLYDYLAGRGSFVDLDNIRPEYLSIFSRDVLRRIAANDDSWECMVPGDVAELIKRRAFFGYVRHRERLDDD